MRDMKWHIYHSKLDVPLCWGEVLLDFDTREDAEKFIESMDDSLQKQYADIKENIWYYDGGYFNASGYTLDTLKKALAEAHMKLYQVMCNADDGTDPIITLALKEYFNQYMEVTV